MGENSVILKISTSISKSCIWSFCHFCPMHNFLLWLIWKIQLFLAILEKSLPENYASVLFCHFGIHSSMYWFPWLIRLEPMWRRRRVGNGSLIARFFKVKLWRLRRWFYKVLRQCFQKRGVLPPPSNPPGCFKVFNGQRYGYI